MSGPNASSRWDPQSYQRNAAFVPALGAPVLALLAPQPGERILDLGCGDGVLTEQIVAAGAVVKGVDASPDMIAAARARGLDADVADGQALTFGPEFGAVFTNAALHWMLQPEAVARGVHEALKAGGRYVGEMGGQGNVSILRNGIRSELVARGYSVPDADPQWYPSVAAFTAIHEAAGFTDIRAELIPRPTELPEGAAGWYQTFRAGWMDVAGVPDALQPEVARAAEARVRDRLLQADGRWLADYVRLRFSMRIPL